MSANQQTTVGCIDADVLAYTAGKDVELDQVLVPFDCLGTAAHVVMLSELDLEPAIIAKRDVPEILKVLRQIVKDHQAGGFEITLEDQDVHLAVERTLTEVLGDIGKKVHTGRSRNDQVAVDIRLYVRDQLVGLSTELNRLVSQLLVFGRKHELVPMVGRTHMQPAMPSSVALWATAFAEALLEDTHGVRSAYAATNGSPLGSAAGYGVPLPLDREKTARLLGFDQLLHNVIHASNARGKHEWLVLTSLSGVMLTLSRMAQDLILYSMPEFGYFTLPRELCTGSSIMPNKYNPDVMEIMRAKASGLLARNQQVASIILSSASGYNRDVQETKEALFEGLETTRQSVRIMERCFHALVVNKEALLKGFRPEVFATDKALELVSSGVSFRDAYHQIKNNLDALEAMDPQEALCKKTHAGATAGLDFDGYEAQLADHVHWAQQASQRHGEVAQQLLG